MDNSGIFTDDRRLKIANDLAEIIEELKYLHTLAVDECAITSYDINKVIESLKNLKLVD